MRIRPILFNTDMVRAILDGRKMVTRRVCKDGNEHTVPDMNFYDADRCTYAVHSYADKEHTDKLSLVERTCPICPDDILYIRETWRVGAWSIRNRMIAFDYKDGTCGKLVYIHDRELFERLVSQSREDARKAGCEYNGVDFIWEKGKSPCRWHPSIHMPKETARIWLKVTDVWVERLQDIKNVYNEGIHFCDCPAGYTWKDTTNMHNCYTDPVGAMEALWNSTIPKGQQDLYSWAANPWVWVIEFERCEKPEAAGEEEWPWQY